eukprot:m51a1_g6933 putative baculoviral iap repeat-containing protein 6 (567) ;mRNA; r:197739-199553
MGHSQSQPRGSSCCVACRPFSLSSATPEQLAKRIELLCGASADPRRPSRTSRGRTSTSRTPWARGTGYGSGEQPAWDVGAHVAQSERRDAEATRAVRALQRLESARPADLQRALSALLRNDSLMDMAMHAELYRAAHELARDRRARGLFAEGADLSRTLAAQADQARALLRAAGGARGGADAAVELAEAVVETARVVGVAAGARGDGDGAVVVVVVVVPQTATAEDMLRASSPSASREPRAEPQAPPSATPEPPPSPHSPDETPTAAPAPGASAAPAPAVAALEAGRLYERVMGPMLYDMGPMQNKEAHHFAGASAGPLTRQAAVRIAQEQAVLAQSLPLNVDSSVFVRVDEDDMSLLRFLVTGPMAADCGRTSTPYAGGCFQFDARFPATYPGAPPAVNLMTTGGGLVRFNPNLYNCGKVCLSLLGTWHGQDGETWDKKTSTFLQVLVSIQSLIFVPQPFYNEPGYECLMATPDGDAQSRQYNETIREATVQHAIIGQLRSPSPGFEEVIRVHMFLQQDRIAKQVAQWISEAEASPEHRERLERLSKEMREEFGKLSYPHPKLPA